MSEKVNNSNDVSADAHAAQPAPTSTFDVELIDGVCWVRPYGERLSLEWNEVRPSVERLLDAMRHESVPRVVFDLANVESFNSAYLSLMLGCWREVDLRGGAMALCRVAPAARELLRLVALDTMWPIGADAHEAARAVSAHTQATQTPTDTRASGSPSCPGAALSEAPPMADGQHTS